MLKPLVTPSFHGISVPKQPKPSCPPPAAKQKQRATMASPFTRGYNPAATALFLHHFAGACGTIWDETLNKMAAYRDLVKHSDTMVRQRWLKSGENKFDCLFQDHGTTEGMDVFDWIHRDQVPRNRKVTYPRYTADIRPENQKPIGPESLQEATTSTIMTMYQRTQPQWKQSRPTGTV